MKNRDKSVVVVGLGKIGLPLALQIAGNGRRVVGVDINPQTVDLINQGKEPFPGEFNLAGRLSETIRTGQLQATTDTTEAVRNASEVIIVVPLYVDDAGVPDFTSMDAATSLVGSGLGKGTLVSFETTVPVGTTRNRFALALARESGLAVGTDFHVVFSPERVLTGRVFADLRRYPKLVGGVTTECGQRGSDFYASVLEFDDRSDLKRPNGVWDLGNCEAAELAKLAETTYRDVNIALANQFAKFAGRNDIDIHAVIEACNSQPFSHIHQPGIAVGGHCIPIYPQMYLWNDPEAAIVRAARETNWSMPEHYIQMLEDAHGSLRGESVLILGASYRGDVKETAFSGVFAVVDALQDRGAKCWVTDPYYSQEELTELGLPSEGRIEDVTAIVIQADHFKFRELDLRRFPQLRTVLNGRSATLKIEANQAVENANGKAPAWPPILRPTKKLDAAVIKTTITS